MISYIDSSFLLSLLLEDERYDEAFLFWHKPDMRVSSRLLEIETLIGLSRYKTEKRKTEDWLQKKLDTFSLTLEEINLLSVDPIVADVVRSTPIITKCKSLDAIHLATALVFQNHYTQKINILSYDRNMNKIARALELDAILL